MPRRTKALEDDPGIGKFGKKWKDRTMESLQENEDLYDEMQRRRREKIGRNVR